MDLITVKGFVSYGEPFVRISFKQQEPHPRHLEIAAQMEGEFGMGYRNIQLNIQQPHPRSISLCAEDFYDGYIQGQLEAIHQLGLCRTYILGALSKAERDLAERMNEAVESAMIYFEQVPA